MRIHSCIHAHAWVLWARFLGHTDQSHPAQLRIQQSFPQSHFACAAHGPQVELEFHEYWKSELEGILFSNQIPLDAEGR
jgi:uncharacterized protein Usg